MRQLVYKYYEYMNMIVATNHPLVRRMDKWFINYIQWSIINHINPHHQSASWPVKWGDLLPPLLWSTYLTATTEPLDIQNIYQLPKIFAPQRVSKTSHVVFSVLINKISKNTTLIWYLVYLYYFWKESFLLHQFQPKWWGLWNVTTK